MTTQFSHEPQPRPSTNPNTPPAATKPPLRRDVWRSNLTSTEKLVLLAMLEIGDSTGRTLKMSVARIAAWCSLSERAVQKALHGDPRNPSRPYGLVTRRLLFPLAKASARKRRPTLYRLQPELLTESPRIERWTKQLALFPEEDSAEQKLMLWIEHNPSAWQSIIQTLQLQSRRWIQKPSDERPTPPVLFAFFAQTAKAHGMADAVARHFAEIAMET